MGDGLDWIGGCEKEIVKKSKGTAKRHDSREGMVDGLIRLKRVDLIRRRLHIDQHHDLDDRKAFASSSSTLE